MRSPGRSRRRPLRPSSAARPAMPASRARPNCVPLDIADHAAVVAFCRRTAIDFVVVGPEAPLVAGIVDDLEAAGIKAFGPMQGGRAARRLQGLHQGPLPAIRHPDRRLSSASPRPAPAKAYVARAAARRSSSRPTGSPPARASSSPTRSREARGRDRHDVRRRPRRRPAPRSWSRNSSSGEEASFFALCDGETAMPLASAQDHKRVFDGDTGPNTGGMGAYSPAPGDDAPRSTRRTMDEIIAADRARHEGDGRAVQGRAVRRADDHRRRARS